jgi:hypothetical protein
MFLLGVGAVLREARGCYTKGKKRNYIKVICHPSSATVCKRNQKVDKKRVVSFSKGWLGSSLPKRWSCIRGNEITTN